MRNVPQQLRARNQWVCWRRDEDGQKIPVDPRTGASASVTDRKNWTTFDTALAAFEADGGLAGIGFVFCEADPFAGVDLDDVIGDDGALEPWAAEVVKRFGATYVEKSPSGRGLKVFLIGKKPAGRCKRDHAESYDRKRFFCVTGEHWPGTGTEVTECQSALEWFCATYLQPPSPSPAKTAQQNSPPPQLASAGSAGSAGSEGSAGSVTWERIVAATLPKQAGERNARILDLARGLKFDAGLGALPLSKVKPIVREWHRQALATIGTKPFDATWAEFIRAWGRARLPLFADVLQSALARAKAKPAPEAKAYDTIEVRLLVSLCRELAGSDGRFFLSTHAAGKLLNVQPMTVQRMFGILIGDELVEIVERGDRHRATRYRWRRECT